MSALCLTSERIIPSNEVKLFSPTKNYTFLTTSSMITTNSKRLRYIYIVMSKVKKYCIFYLYFRFLLFFLSLLPLFTPSLSLTTIY